MKAEPLEKKISRRTSESKHYSASQGFFLSSKAPLGYRKWTTDDPREWDSRELIVEPKSSQAIKESFEKYATGEYSYSDIANLLAKKGFTSANGHPFSRETIRLMLSNKTYVGLIEYKGNEVYRGKHEPIISVDLWDKVQKIRNEFE